jgi:hypothetical protein
VSFVLGVLFIATALGLATAGTLYLIAYAAGLALVLMLVSILGQRFTRNAGWATDPNGWFKRGLGILFVIIGILVITGVDKKLQTWLVEKGYFPASSIEEGLLKRVDRGNDESVSGHSPSIYSFPLYREIAHKDVF